MWSPCEAQIQVLVFTPAVLAIPSPMHVCSICRCSQLSTWPIFIGLICVSIATELVRRTPIFVCAFDDCIESVSRSPRIVTDQPSQAVCSVQTITTLAPGRHLSFSSTLGSPACAASFMLYFLLLTLEQCLSVEFILKFGAQLLHLSSNPVLT